MESPFEIFPRHDHSPRWKAAELKDPGRCPGKDTTDTKCTCPDVMYATKIRLLTGETTDSRLYCGCCDLVIVH